MLSLLTLFCSQPTAFETLTHALERHHSSSVSSYTPSRPSRSYTSSSAESSISASPRLPTSEINVPGEAFIEPHERAGLPASRPERRGEHKFSESELHAAHVVRAHSGKPFSKRFFRRRFRPTATWANESTDQEEGTRQMNPPMTRARGGILAALLALYDRDSDVASISDTQEHPSRISPTHSPHDLASVTGKRLAAASKSIHLPESRPRRQRNAAGVWGPLIASTSGTLVAPAAPTHSAIAPDVKRPGYHLSRYSHFRPSVIHLTEDFFTDTRWTMAPTGPPQISLRKDRGVCHLKQARNTTRPAPRHRTPQLTPVHTWTLLPPFRYRVLLILGGGPNTCVIYPRVVLVVIPAPWWERKTPRRTRRLLMRRVI